MEWILRLSDDESSEADIAAWLKWYEGDEGNRQIFDELQRFWIETGSLNLRVRDNGPAFRPVSRKVAALAACLLTVCLALFPNNTVHVEIQALGLNPPPRAAGVRHAQLPDGSSVDLAAHASLAVSYTAAQRTLVLSSGEAFFSVAPNHERPFVVKTAAVRILAVGTKFNVREEDDRVVVTVVEGIVDVSAEGGLASGESAPLRINAGNEVTWFLTRGDRIVHAAVPANVLTWREGRLDYVNESLATVIADVSRYSDRNLVARGTGISQLRYTGTVMLDSIEEWLRAIPSEFPIDVVQEKGEATIIESRPGADDH